jgi:hypothetical protein
MKRAFMRTLAVATGLVCAACQSGDRGDELRIPEGAEASAAEATDSETSGIASRQKAFLQALAGQGGDPSALMSTRFTYRDRLNPADSIGRAPGGAYGIGGDYFRALSDRLPPSYAVAESMEVFQQRSGEVLVITRHPNTLPSVTRWEQQGSEWLATSFVINVDEAALRSYSNSRI